MYNVTDYINVLKARAGLTNQSLADITGIPLGTLSKYVAYIDDDSARFSTVAKLVKAMGGSLDEMVGIVVVPPLMPIEQPTNTSERRSVSGIHRNADTYDADIQAILDQLDGIRATVETLSAQRIASSVRVLFLNMLRSRTRGFDIDDI